MDLTPAALNALFLTVSTLFWQGYKTAPIYWNKLATLIPSTSEQNLYGWMGRIPAMREWLGSRVINNVAGRNLTVTNRTFEDTIGIPREKVEDDQYGLYAPLITELGWQAAKWPDYLMVDTIQANATGFDGVAFFNNAHPTDPNDSTKGTQSNDYSLALTSNNYATVRQSMMKYTAEDGKSLGIMPSLLIVPPDLEYTARHILNTDFIAPGTVGNETGQVGSTQNVLKGSADLLVIPELQNNPTQWFLADVSRPIKPFIFQQRRAPRFTYLVNPNDPNVFFNKELIYGADARGEGLLSLWFLASRSTG